ncbi:hypothetical protein MIZ03_3869 [Rhodoferax lithotrophicus]|uniref:Uncharacterized protein n=1 Tax=Rhodoferax lithotrophicus TaxID=2798804 RepID=A0ABM7MRG3_9BURK|nr:hypothetical protein [Rhodoferax sp. MIZ03]BCO28959.1 hypothetical protein MIZ03_3869 [Rhodoferax sp. MIZ03]
MPAPQVASLLEQNTAALRAKQFEPAEALLRGPLQLVPDRSEAQANLA